jgi:hypothetical protein
MNVFATVPDPRPPIAPHTLPDAAATACQGVGAGRGCAAVKP